jgi:hypothetical protein
MEASILRKRGLLLGARTLKAGASIAVLIGVSTLLAQESGIPPNLFIPGSLVLTRSVYTNGHNITAQVTNLPPGCTPISPSNPNPADPCALAVIDSAYPFVFNNDTVDGSFGITSKIFLDQISRSGSLVTSLEVPNSTQPGVTAAGDQMVTSFPSKSELALNLSVDGKTLTFMGYFAPVSAIDVSNSNTPGEIDPTNPVVPAYYRAVAQIDTLGRFHFTLTNAFTGDNGRAALLNDSGDVFYMAGNAGNGTAIPQPAGTILGTGAQIATPANEPEQLQTPGTPTAVGSFNITQLGDPSDKIGKDTNFRGMTVFNNVLYYSKGSGSNGVNTVYFVDSTETVCTNSNGVGLPVAGASLPASPLVLTTTDPTTIQEYGLQPDNMCILKGFPTTLANASSGVSYPFGLWFASPTVLYVADEGSGTAGTTVAGFYDPATPAQNPTAGLQKWIFNGTEWQLAYILTNGLNLGVPYTVPGYPTGLNDAAGGSLLPWAPATDGLRNITGIVNSDGTATIYAITSTISGSGDQGADPNKLVAITDDMRAATLPATEGFQTLKTASAGEVLRGVAFAPGTRTR